MAHEIETFAYAGEPAWHGLGVEVSNDLTPEEMMKAAQLDWEVKKLPLYSPFWDNGEDQAPVMQRAHGEFGLWRMSDRKLLSRVGENWHVNQNRNVFEFFKKYCEAGHMTMETAGSLKSGKFIFGLANIGKEFELITGDKIKGYMLLCSPHAYGFKFTIQFTGIRVVCNNTLTYSLREGPLAGTEGFRMAHTRPFDADAQREAEETLGLAVKRFDWLKEISEKLAECRVNYEDRIAYFKRVAKVEDIENDGEDTSTEEELPRIVKKFETAWHDAPGQQLPSAKDTCWGLVNAVTYTVDHELGRTRDSGLYNSWLGQNKNMKQRAVDYAMELAEAA